MKDKSFDAWKELKGHLGRRWVLNQDLNSEIRLTAHDKEVYRGFSLMLLLEDGTVLQHRISFPRLMDAQFTANKVLASLSLGVMTAADNVVYEELFKKVN